MDCGTPWRPILTLPITIGPSWTIGPMFLDGRTWTISRQTMLWAGTAVQDIGSFLFPSPITGRGLSRNVILRVIRTS